MVYMMGERKMEIVKIYKFCEVSDLWGHKTSGMQITGTLVVLN